jgi:hypothetical protein
MVTKKGKENNCIIDWAFSPKEPLYFLLKREIKTEN